MIPQTSDRMESVGPIGATSRVAAPCDEARGQCRDCPSRTVCLPHGLDDGEIDGFDQSIRARARVLKGETLFGAGSALYAVCAIRSGTFMTLIGSPDRRQQVLGYHIQGEVVGFDGIATGQHVCTAIATSEAEVCVVPFDRLEVRARAVPALQGSLLRLLGHEIRSNRQRLLRLGSMGAPAKLACFLLELAERHRRRGLPHTKLTLHLFRDQLGQHLGLQIETVSRTFTRLEAAGMLRVRAREIELLDPKALRALIRAENCRSCGEFGADATQDLGRT